MEELLFILRGMGNVRGPRNGVSYHFNKWYGVITILPPLRDGHVCSRADVAGARRWYKHLRVLLRYCLDSKLLLILILLTLLILLILTNGHSFLSRATVVIVWVEKIVPALPGRTFVNIRSYIPPLLTLVTLYPHFFSYNVGHSI